LIVRGLLLRSSILPAVALAAAGLLLFMGALASQDFSEGDVGVLQVAGEAASSQSFLGTHPWSSGMAAGGETFWTTDLLSPWPDAPQVLLPVTSAPREGIGENRWGSPKIAPRFSSQPVALLSPSVDLPQDLLPLASPSPATICDGLAAAGFANSGWKKSEFLAPQWECFRETEREGQTLESEPFSLFFMLRGRDSAWLDEMRMKVTLRDPAAAAALSSQTAKFLDAFSSVAKVRFPPVFLNAVITRRWAQYISENAIYTVSMEYGEQVRYNVTAVFTRSRGKFLQMSEGAMNASEWQGIKAD
jgi:hypothetical protein